MKTLKKIKLLIQLTLPLSLVSAFSLSAANNSSDLPPLGWMESDNACGGYFIDPTLSDSSTESVDPDDITVTTNSGLLSQQATSVLEGLVTIRRDKQTLTGNKVFLYRDPATGKLVAIDMVGDVHFFEKSSLVVAKKGHYNINSASKTLQDIFYRTTVNLDNKKKKSQRLPTEKLVAWGKADTFEQHEPEVYRLTGASYTTCSPISPFWQLKAKDIVLNKNTGRGYATHAEVLIKNVPIFYWPYINFPIDKQRKTGFLWPTIGTSNKWGPYFLAPFYWNMAPNMDMTFIPGFLQKRGLQLTDHYRYLTETTKGNINISVSPHDRAFVQFQKEASVNPVYVNPTNTPIQSQSVTEAELQRLLSASSTRGGFLWRNDAHYNEHWSSNIDFNYASDDYYLKDYGKNLNEVSANQLLQEGDVSYKGQNWNFIGRLQAYQTLHPINEVPVLNQYRRFPQLILSGDYPPSSNGLEYFIQNEFTHFDIRKTPGANTTLPIGNRINIQPGISWPRYRSWFFINPRLQLAMTQYGLNQLKEFNQGQPSNNQTPHTINRYVPIFDITSGISLERKTTLFHHVFRQTLEPQFYYTYIPYHNQSDIPVFDTTVNNLTYDQVFNYNRFTGIDRIGDANQLALGVSTKLIDEQSGIEKVRFSIGEIIYFANRRVTLCNDNSCSDNPDNPSNKQPVSPISSTFNYHLSNDWSFNANAIISPITKQLDNSTIWFQYHPDEVHLINLGFTYARSGDIFSGISSNDSVNNLKITDISGTWPIMGRLNFVGRLSQNWNQDHLQNLVYGLQYDTCCVSVQLVGGRTFTGFDTGHNNRPQYNTEIYLQFTLKGLGQFDMGHAGGLLRGIPNFQPLFGQSW